MPVVISDNLSTCLDNSSENNGPYAHIVANTAEFDEFDGLPSLLSKDDQVVNTPGMIKKAVSVFPEARNIVDVETNGATQLTENKFVGDVLWNARHAIENSDGRMSNVIRTDNSPTMVTRSRSGAGIDRNEVYTTAAVGPILLQPCSSGIEAILAVKVIGVVGLLSLVGYKLYQSIKIFGLDPQPKDSQSK
jgi:hypothetical protein